MIRRVLLAGLGLVLSTTPLAAALAQAKTGDAPPYDSALPPPDDVPGLLRNLKRATEQGWLMRDDLYGGDKLKRVTGGTDLRWTNQTSGKIAGRITGFDALAEPVLHNGQSFPGLELVFAQNAEERLGDGIWTTWSLSFLGRSRPDFATLEAIFGRQLQATPIQPTPHTPPLQTPTRPHGNELIEYGATTPTFAWKATFYLTADAKLDYAYFRVAKLPR